MANSLTSNYARKLLEQFLIDMETQRVLSKSVNTQLFSGKFNPSSGPVIDVKRPHRYKALRTSGGDISAETPNTIISGKATATVQNYITVKIPYTNYEEALELNQLSEITKPAAEECVTELETSFADYMLLNTGLAWGDPDVAVTKWSHLAGPMALMKSIGVPGNELNYAMNPYIATNLADTQSGLASGDNELVNLAWKKAQISNNFAGLNAFSCDSLSNFTTGAASDREGTLSASPVVTYSNAKDTMTQQLAVTAFTAAAVIKAGSVIELPASHYIHQRTRRAFLDQAGNAVPFRATVTADVTLGASGEGTLVVTGPAVYEAGAAGQYNNVDVAPVSGAVIKVLGTASTLYQPNLFYHKNAFTITTVKLPKLHATDARVVSKDGIAIRVTKYSDGDKNEQNIRFDMLPAFGTLNPFFAGKGFGAA